MPGIGLKSDQRRKEEAKSEGGHNSDAEDYENEILKAINDEEKKLNDHESELSSLPSETDEGYVAATVKSKQVNTNQIAKVANLVK